MAQNGAGTGRAIVGPAGSNAVPDEWQVISRRRQAPARGICESVLMHNLRARLPTEVWLPAVLKRRSGHDPRNMRLQFNTLTGTLGRDVRVRRNRETPRLATHGRGCAMRRREPPDLLAIALHMG